MEISRDSRTIIRLAVAGAMIAAAVAALLFVYLKSGPPNSWITTGAVLEAVVLCPGFIPFGWAAGVELEMPSLSVIWFSITVINFCALCGHWNRLRKIAEPARGNEYHVTRAASFSLWDGRTLAIMEHAGLKPGLYKTKATEHK